MTSFNSFQKWGKENICVNFVILRQLHLLILRDTQMMPLLLLHCISDVTSYSFVNWVAVVKVGAIVRLGRCCDTSPSCLPRRFRIFWTVTRSSRRSDKLRHVSQGGSLLISNHQSSSSSLTQELDSAGARPGGSGHGAQDHQHPLPAGPQHAGQAQSGRG